MSGWKLIVRSLHDKGGGPLPRAAFEDGSTGSYALEKAKAHGLIRYVRRAYWSLWELTPLGFDWCAGRVEITKRGPVSTWLHALPKPGEIRL